MFKTPTLSATNLTPYCYATMFSGCTSLTAPCELPATILKNYCYNGMFQWAATGTRYSIDPIKSVTSGGTN